MPICGVIIKTWVNYEKIYLKSQGSLSVLDLKSHKKASDASEPERSIVGAA